MGHAFDPQDRAQSLLMELDRLLERRKRYEDALRVTDEKIRSVIAQAMVEWGEYPFASSHLKALIAVVNPPRYN